MPSHGETGEVSDQIREYMAENGFVDFSYAPGDDYINFSRRDGTSALIRKDIMPELFGKGGTAKNRAAEWNPICMDGREECSWSGNTAVCGDCGKNYMTYGAVDEDRTEDVKPQAQSADLAATAAAVGLVMKSLGMDLEDENFRDTPQRVAKALSSFCKGEAGIEEAMSSDFTFDSDSDTLVALQNIPVAAMCPHHLMPWFGTVDLGYIPNGKVLGLSKFPRLVHALSHTCPMMQESFTDLLAEMTQRRLTARGLIVTVRSKHTCMVCRGVETPQVDTITSRVSGIFRDVPAARQEFLMLTQRR
jgi:GTP cyclohydrolase I